jgi:RNA-directed DNA polymerase
MSTASKPMYDWKNIPWKKVLREVFKLQKRIYQASLRGDKRTVCKLQRLLIKSWYGRLLAVRRVTQDNQGKKTPGIDGVVILDPIRKIELSQTIDFKGKPQPVKRVYITKPGKQEKRPLGIPVIRDRAKQAVIKQALEPEWEAKFESKSYGFRPGRGCHDAVEEIFQNIAHQSKFVLDADIAKCFDRIDHKQLIDKLDTIPLIRRIIQEWLKAGIMEGDVFYTSDRGVPQGGVISPLLANIALHGLETDIESAFPKRKSFKGRQIHWRPKVIRYADDFVILHRDAQEIETAREHTKTWLTKVGLELKPEKTRLTHTLNPLEQEEPGFDFLGFTVRQFPTNKATKSDAARDDGKHLQYKTLIKPSKAGIQRHVDKLKGIIRNHRSKRQDKLIRALNPIIRGWCNYYSTVVSKEIFNKISYILFQMLWAWAKRRHPNKSKHWIYNRYWVIYEGKRVFKDKDSPSLLEHPRVPIRRHIKVQGTRSPFDGDWLYWATRMGRHPEVESKVAKALKKQHGKCALCGLYFTEMDMPCVYNLKEKGQIKAYWLAHNHCQERSTRHGQVTEEPYDGKLSSTVLEPSWEGDLPA